MTGGSIVQFFDNSSNAQSPITGVPVAFGPNGFHSWVDNNPKNASEGVVAIGGARGKERVELLRFFNQHSIDTPTLVHSNATVSSSSTVGEGSHIFAGSIIAAEASIGPGCILNHGAQLDHESTIGSGVHLAPGVVICGCVRIGSYTMIGARSVVLPRVTIGNNVIVGAASLVTKSLPDNVIAYGSPAKIVRSNHSHRI